MRILVVDDDEVDAEYIRRTLRNSSQGVDIEVASTVDDALSVCTLKNFDVILLDYRLPGRDGIELVFELKANPQIPDSAIVMMSTSENDELAKTCIQAGAQDFILKSEITPSKLRRCIINSQTRYELERQLKESHERIRLLAEKDPLTEIANRRYFEDKLKQTVNQCIRKKSQFALLILDLDNFKYANDSFGHDNGDVLLKKVTTRIRSTLRGFELFARLGGDEFAILIPEVDRLNVPSMIANRILHVLEKPFELGGLSISTSASIGVVLFPQDGSSSEELLKNADIAMYRSKKKGKGQFSYFEQEMHYQILERVNIEKEILYGLRNNEFVLQFQPIISSVNPLEIEGDEGPFFEEKFGMEAVLGILVVELFSEGFFGKEV